MEGRRRLLGAGAIGLVLGAASVGVWAHLANADGAATPTTARGATSTLTVRVQADGAKWVSTEVGGAVVTVRDADSGAVLGTGQVLGTSGDTAAIMAPRSPLTPTPTDGGAASVVLALPVDDVTRVSVEARGPLLGDSPVSSSSAQTWLVPGATQSLDLQLHGLIVTVLAPAPHGTVPASSSVAVRASVENLCGCGIDPSLPWKPDLYTVTALVRAPDGTVTSFPLAFSATSTFAGDVKVGGAGSYVITVVADMPSLGNVGVARTSVLVAP